MADQHLTRIFTEEPGLPLTWAKAILAAHARAFEAEDALYRSQPIGSNAGQSEFGCLRASVHANVLDAVHALVETGEALQQMQGA